MAEPLYELLVPYSDLQSSTYLLRPSPKDAVTINYLNRLSTLALSDLTDSEPQSLSHSSQSNARALQALSKRSYKSIVNSADHLSTLEATLPSLFTNIQELREGLPEVENEASRFSQKFSKSLENAALDRRRKALMLSRNVDRVSDILDMPTLLSSTISSSSGGANQPTVSGAVTSTGNYASALDLHAHIKRLHALYPNLSMVNSIAAQAEEEMQSMKGQLITSLQTQGVKLAGAMRTIGWLRRVAPELDEQRIPGKGNSEGALGVLFLSCRLANLTSMLDALEPLKDLADQETRRRLDASQSRDKRLGGQQTERYLKRYIEIFREQSFAIISMHKSIFPSALPGPTPSEDKDDLGVKLKTPNRSGFGMDENQLPDDLVQPLPSALSTFTMHLVELLTDTLQTYLPNVQDRSSRDSLLTQVLYCAGSLGRLGGDFGMILSLLRSDDDSEAGDVEWIEVMKKHRVQASRLELLASGVGGKNANAAMKNSSPISS
ncbi:Dor1-domain-containing protein [Viridothelium virens]|uniref:Conserved oligomeric Golgi complex subunit 8 n=1 Tax=Viridothelium virens TaxID=1048519 RepID=A0A6A6HLN8_VIRVR|nr:Dor1-domain-containing protein [Viridothelium virens]